MAKIYHKPRAKVTCDTSRYEQYRDHFEAASNSAKGIILTYPTNFDAASARMNFYALRRMDRRNNAIIYPPTDGMHRRSAYDDIIVRLVDNELHLVKLEREQINPTIREIA
jgi:hypothetical protein